MNKNNENNEKHLKTMLKRLSSFENNRFDLHELVIYLETLIHLTDNVEEDWREKFFDEFCTLESINAKEPNMTKEEINKLIRDATSNLKKLIEEKLREISFSSYNGKTLGDENFDD